MRVGASGAIAVLLLSSPAVATEISLYRTMEEHAQAAQRIQAPEHPPLAQRRHSRIHRVAYIAHGVDLLTTWYGVCRGGFAEGNKILTAFGNDCEAIVWTRAIGKAIYLTIGEVLERRTRKRCPRCWKLLNRRWAFIMAFGAVPAAWNTYQLIAEDGAR